MTNLYCKFSNNVMDHLASMRIFVAVAKLGSFVAAARQLALSPSVVTRSIAQLEDQLGLALITRTTRSLTCISTPSRRKHSSVLRQSAAEA